MSDNPFDDIEKEDMSGSGNGIYFVPGDYPELKIQQCKFRAAKQTYKGSDVFIALLEVVQSNVPERKPGAVIEYIVKAKKKDGAPNPFYYKNIKKLLMAAFNTTDPADIDKDLMALVIGEKQAAAGKHVSAVATNVPTDAGGTFTSVDFKHVIASGKAKTLAQAEA